MENIKVDLIVNGGVEGDFSTLNHLDIGRMRPFVYNGKSYISIYKGVNEKGEKQFQTIPIQNNASLRMDEWKQLDEAVLMEQQKRSVGIADLESRRLVYTLANPLGTTVLAYDDIDDSMEAEISMDGITRSKGGSPNYTRKYLPIPIIHGDYEISLRDLEASRKLGMPLDVTKAQLVARRITEKLEQLLFTNSTYSKGGQGTIYSYVNHPNRNTQTLTKQWNDANKTPQEILNDVIAMKQKLINKGFYGPYVVYIPTIYETILDKDYNTTTSGTSDTIRDRILKIQGIEAVKVSDFLPEHNVVMVQMTSDVVRVVKGFDIQNIEWKAEGGFVNFYKAITIKVPQIRASQSGACGVVHLA